MPVPSLTSLGLLIGLSFFFGLAFEQFYAKAEDKPPGGIRTFPSLAVAGGVLYLLDTKHFLLLAAGLLILGIWLSIYYRTRIKESGREDDGRAALLVPVCNLLAFLLGPIAIAAPPWLAVGISVAAVLLLTSRERLHDLARKVNNEEIITAGEFLILTGLVLPLLPDTPVTTLTSITPYKAWLALLAVCTISYASYLIRRHVAPKDSDLWVAILGGFYSSTATTVVLARRARREPATLPRAGAGITLATALMYLRFLVLVGVFNWSLAVTLAPALIGLSVLGMVLAGVQYRFAGARVKEESEHEAQQNPLELGSAAVFALSFIIVSIVTNWVRTHYGQTGIEVLAALVGVSDIDPLVLNLAQGGTGTMSAGAAASAILIASGSNNLIKAIYTAVFAGVRATLPTIAALVALGAIAVAIGLLM